jgi:hypothetical protein
MVGLRMRMNKVYWMIQLIYISSDIFLGSHVPDSHRQARRYVFIGACVLEWMDGCMRAHIYAISYISFPFLSLSLFHNPLSIILSLSLPLPGGEPVSRFPCVFCPFSCPILSNPIQSYPKSDAFPSNPKSPFHPSIISPSHMLCHVLSLASQPTLYLHNPPSPGCISAPSPAPTNSPLSFSSQKHKSRPLPSFSSPPPPL